MSGIIVRIWPNALTIDNWHLGRLSTCLHALKELSHCSLQSATHATGNALWEDISPMQFLFNMYRNLCNCGVIKPFMVLTAQKKSSGQRTNNSIIADLQHFFIRRNMT